MFCPKCGNQIADGAKFCPKCGNAIAAAPVAATPVQPAPQTAPAASPVVSAPAHSAFDITRIVPAVPAVLAMVFACMPWIIVDQSVVSASNFVGGFAGFLTGTDSSAHSFAESYNAWQFGDAGRMLEYYGASSGAGTLFSLLMIAWVVSMILLAVGIILQLASGKRSLLMTGFVAMTLTGVASGYIVTATDFSSEVTNILLTVLMCLVGFVVASIVRPKRA